MPVLVWAALGPAACDDAPKPVEPTTKGADCPPAQRVRVLTYNVHGMIELPGIFENRAMQRLPAIAAKLVRLPMATASFDLVLLQEMFHCQAAGMFRLEPAAYPYQSDRPGSCIAVWQDEDEVQGNEAQGDGLNHFASPAFDRPALAAQSFERVDWSVCHGSLADGSDCLTKKGATFARHALTAGGCVDVYNLHMDAGQGREDVEARAVQVEQLIAYVAQQSGAPKAGCAVIVAGDFNMRPGDALLHRLRHALALQDACGENRIDQVLFRPGGDRDAQVRPLACWLPEDLQSRNGLSDHDALAVELCFGG